MYGWIRAKGLSGRSMRLILLVAVAVLLLCSSASATPLSYTFDHNNQGWQVSQDGMSYDPATFQLAKGNPPGSLTARTPALTAAVRATPAAFCIRQSRSSDARRNYGRHRIL